MGISVFIGVHVDLVSVWIFLLVGFGGLRFFCLPNKEATFLRRGSLALWELMLLFFCSSFACHKEERRKGQKKRCFHAQASPVPAVFVIHALLI